MRFKSSGAGASGSGYKPKTGGKSKHTGKNSRDFNKNKSYKPKNKNYRGGGANRGKDRDRSGDRDGSRDRSKDDKHSGKSKGETPQNFLDMWQNGLFMREAVEAVSEKGLKCQLALDMTNFKTPSRITRCLSAWEKVSNDEWVLRVVREGYKLQFKIGPPSTPRHGRNPPSTAESRAILDTEAAAVIEKGAATIVSHSVKEVTSGFFARPKKGQNKWRPIVNLKFLNKYLRKISFRMTTVADIRIGVLPGYYFTSLDLTDAYYSVPLHKSAWPYVRFVWRGVVYEYHTLVFGLASSPRVFTKMVTAAVKFLKVAFMIWLTGFIDDFLIMARDPYLCLLHTHICILVFHILGFEVNMKKSSLIPSTKIEHLGFIFDSQAMTLILPQEKIDKVVGLVSGYLERNFISADQLRSLIGRLESVKPAVELAPLHYRSLQQMLRPLQQGDWCGSQVLQLTLGARLDLVWWRKLSTSSATAPLTRGSFTVTVKSDASGTFGWGGHSSRGEFAQGEWTAQEAPWHINKKELVAAHRSLVSMMRQGDFVSLFLDSRTAVAFVNRQGGTRSVKLCSTALELWELVLARKGWIKATWLPRDLNQAADMLSKAAIETWEVSLSREVLEMIFSRWFSPTMDMFASQDCHVLPRFCSWFPDKDAYARDAFSLMRWPDRCYCFPPVPLINLMLERIRRDKVRAIIVVPMWPISVWWPSLQEMVLEGPLNLGFYKQILSSPLGRKLPYLNPLVAYLVSGHLV